MEHRAKKVRADVLLVQKGITQTRTQAQALIESHAVHLVDQKNKMLLTRPSQLIFDEAHLEVDTRMLKYVSRAGFKLENALQRTKLQAKGFKVLDIGQSTGGFTDCLLQAGADLVCGIDVGHGQLHEKLKNNAKVQSIEGFHLKELKEKNPWPEQKFDLVVVDVSFISIEHVFYAIEKLTPPLYFLGLVKPQFELGAQALSKSGVVKDKQRYNELEQKIKRLAEKTSWLTLDYFNSAYPGKDGNEEFFIYAQKI